MNGRADKRFCDVNCRNLYHNHKDGVAQQCMRLINYALRRNRAILAELYVELGENNKVTKDVLLFKGFQLNYHTETIAHRGHGTLHVCYDYCYKYLDKDTVNVLPLNTYLVQHLLPVRNIAPHYRPRNRLVPTPKAD